jgi:hypothetical protein
MKKVMLLLVVIVGMTSCNDSKSVKQSKKEMLISASEMSSLNYDVTIKAYLINHNTDVISFEALDSIRKVSDKRCNGIISDGVDKVYKKK